MVKMFRMGFAFFLALISAISLGAVSTVSPAWAVDGWVQVGSDIDGEAAGDYSGKSVSLSSDGSRVAIGAPNNYGGADYAGHVRVYEWTGSAWAQLGSDINGEAFDDLSGRSVSLSSDGSRVAIGAARNDGGGDSAGHVRVYSWTGSVWVQMGSDIDGEAAGDYSAEEVSLSANGTRVAIGAQSNAGGGDYRGHVRVYDWNGSAWVQVGSDIDGEAQYDSSSTSVSLSPDGSTVAIGSRWNSGAGLMMSGHVRVYGLTGGAWAQLGSDIDGEASFDGSGASVSLSSDGSRVAIGAVNNDGNGGNSGHVRVYGLTGGAWVQVGSDIDGAAAGDNSGYSVSLSSDGSRVAIGANGNDGGGIDAGQVRVYDLTGGAWVQVGCDINGEAAGDASGMPVSLTSGGSRVAIGAIANDGAGSLAGHVRVYDLTSSGGGCGGGGGGGGGAITSEPRNLTVSKKLTSERNLAWKAPKNLNGGSITDYIIQYRVARTNLWSTFTDGISTNRRVKVTGLTKNVKYQFQVSARTSGGDSPFSKAT
jgi:hypothetical protein